MDVCLQSRLPQQNKNITLERQKYYLTLQSENCPCSVTQRNDFFYCTLKGQKSSPFSKGGEHKSFLVCLLLQLLHYYYVLFLS